MCFSINLLLNGRDELLLFIFKLWSNVEILWSENSVESIRARGGFVFYPLAGSFSRGTLSFWRSGYLKPWDNCVFESNRRVDVASAWTTATIRKINAIEFRNIRINFISKHTKYCRTNYGRVSFFLTNAVLLSTYSSWNEITLCMHIRSTFLAVQSAYPIFMLLEKVKINIGLRTYRLCAI